MAALIACSTRILWGAAFSQVPGPPMPRIQRARSQLPELHELPREEPVVEKEPEAPEPPRRLAYKLDITSHLPEHEHLHDDSMTRTKIKDKVSLHLQKYEEHLRSVSVTLDKDNNFHKVDNPAMHHHKNHHASPEASQEVVIEDDSIMLERKTPGLKKQLAPFIFKAVVTLKSGSNFVISNPEKHAQPSLSEGLDHLVDLMSKMIREKIGREIKSQHRASTAEQDSEEDSLGEFLLGAEDVSQESLEEEAAREQMYKNVQQTIQGAVL